MYKTIYAPTPNGGTIELSVDEKAYAWIQATKPLASMVELNKLPWQTTRPRKDDFAEFMKSIGAEERSKS